MALDFPDVGEIEDVEYGLITPVSTDELVKRVEPVSLELLGSRPVASVSVVTALEEDVAILSSPAVQSRVAAEESRVLYSVTVHHLTTLVSPRERAVLLTLLGTNSGSRTKWLVLRVTFHVEGSLFRKERVSPSSDVDLNELDTESDALEEGNFELAAGEEPALTNDSMRGSALDAKLLVASYDSKLWGCFVVLAKVANGKWFEEMVEIGVEPNEGYEISLKFAWPTLEVEVAGDILNVFRDVLLP